MTDELSQLRAISEGQIRMYDKVIIFAAVCFGFACGAFAGMVLL